MARTTPSLLLVALTVLAGCGHASTTKNNSKTASGTSKDTGKVYTSDSKGGGTAPGGQTGSGSNAPLPAPAETINGRASAASDEGSVSATKGQVVMTPGAPVAHSPGKQ